MPRKKKPASPKLPTPIEAVKHKDKRANIPTEELRDFIAEDEKKPKTILYPRDPSLDPQLVWKGKDEQDRQPLAVPAVPIYIQEHIKPQAIIDLVRSTPLSRGRGVGGEVEFQPSLFADFNGLSFEERVDFYHHEQNWTNRMILGDSLLVMTSLAEKEGLKGKVQMIYFDPPYGIKFGSNWQVSTRKRDVKDGKAEDATRQPEQVKAFRDTWQWGIHSYLSYLRDRLVVARELLAESGSIFVQIGDENVHLVRCVLDEVFGSENFVSMIAYKTTSGVAQALAPRRICDYIIWYAKVRESLKFRRLYIQSSLDLDFFNRVEEVSGHRRPITIEEINNRYSIPTGARQFYSLPLHSRGAGDNVPRMYNSRKWAIPADRHWSHTQEGFQRLTLANRIVEEKTVIRSVVYWDDFPYVELSAYWDDTGPEMDKYYAVQTSTKPIERCMLMCTDPGDLVLDPTCGSGTTAYVAEQWGRRWITIDTSRVAIALARTRLMSGRFPYYLLADSPEGRRKEAEVSGQFSVTSDQSADDRSPMTDHSDIKRGFVYERVPHVTLKSIANNEEIDEIHAKYQPELERLRAEINKAAKQKWEEWEIPTPSPALPHLQKPQIGEGERALLEEYWQVRRARQKEIDASIARHADIEFLYDKPYEDKKRIRVAGPFTVESLSPHRVLAPDDPATAFREDALNTQDFVQMILENLKASGVQNTIKNQRLKFDSLEPYAGTWIHAVGTYTERLPSPSGIQGRTG